MTVDETYEFFKHDQSLAQSVEVVKQVGFGYIRLGQPATELLEGEALNIKLASESKRTQRRNTLYL